MWGTWTVESETSEQSPQICKNRRRCACGQRPLIHQGNLLVQRQRQRCALPAVRQTSYKSLACNRPQGLSHLLTCHLLCISRNSLFPLGVIMSWSPPNLLSLKEVGCTGQGGHCNKYRRLGGLTAMYFLTFLELKVQDQDAIRFDFFWDLSPWLVNGHLLSPHGLSSVLVCGHNSLFFMQTLVVLD